jgi:chromosomal replication initiator protein
MTELWNAVLDDLARKVSAHNFDAWFRNLSLHHSGDETAYLEVEDDFFKAWIEENYVDLIEESLTSVTGDEWQVVIEIRGSYEDEPKSNGEVRLDAPLAAAAPRETRNVSTSVEPPPGPLFEVREPSVEDRVVQYGLNPRYTFDEFVVGASNQFVHAASAAVASNPARTYNPLFIFGGVGLGKTHLLQAIGIEAIKRDPTTRVVYLSSEEFMNEMITSLRNKSMNQFRAQFRNNCDLLLIDDIQFIGGKDSTQEEFFHTFNALYHSGKQIVLTSDKSPNELPGIEERLASRFAWGLIADIQPPEMETRIAILEKKAEADGIELDKEVAILLASCVRSNVRELEGTLIRLGAQAKLLGQPISVDFARQMLKRMNLEQGRTVTPERIMKLVAGHFDIKVSDIKSSSRAHAISRPRQIAMYLSRKHTEHSFPELGRAFNKDHTTVIAACKKLDGLLGSDDPLAIAADEIETILLR